MRCEPIQIRGLHLAAEAADVRVAHVVVQDEQDVRLGRHVDVKVINEMRGQSPSVQAQARVTKEVGLGEIGLQTDCVTHMDMP